MLIKTKTMKKWHGDAARSKNNTDRMSSVLSRFYFQI